MIGSNSPRAKQWMRLEREIKSRCVDLNNGLAVAEAALGKWNLYTIDIWRSIEGQSSEALRAQLDTLAASERDPALVAAVAYDLSKHDQAWGDVLRGWAEHQEGFTPPEE